MAKLVLTNPVALPPMQWIQQRGDRDCGLCVTAMLAGLSYEEVLADVPDYENKSDDWWLAYLRHHGWNVHSQGGTEFRQGFRYYCVVAVPGERDKRQCHAIAVDENGTVFDPGRKVRCPGERQLSDYTATFQLVGCFRLRKP